MSLLHEALARERIATRCAEQQSAAAARIQAGRLRALRRWKRRARHAAARARQARAEIS